MTTTLPNDGRIALTLQTPAGAKIPLTESAVRGFLALLLGECERARADGRRARLDLSCAERTVFFEGTANQLRAFAAQLEAGLSVWAARCLARGRPIAKTDRFVRDAAGEITQIKTMFEY